jgi:AcrR family transcriptional regulator
MTKERQLRKQEEIRNSILDAAKEIIERDGIQGLSIRKITNSIEYSPAIIYHYFKDKNEIVETLVEEGYRNILTSIASVKRNDEQPEQEIREVFSNYIKAALDSPEEYKAFMLNSDPSVLKKTALLEKGISESSRSIGLLCDVLRRGIEKGRFAECDLELSAQIIWTSAFGLTIKLILEGNVERVQIDRLIEQHFNILFNGIMRRKEDK